MSTWRASANPGAATVEPSRDRKPGEHRMTVTVSVPVEVDPGAARLLLQRVLGVIANFLGALRHMLLGLVRTGRPRSLSQLTRSTPPALSLR